MACYDGIQGTLTHTVWCTRPPKDHHKLQRIVTTAGVCPGIIILPKRKKKNREREREKERKIETKREKIR
jgi:hypothetical protein